MKNISCKLFLIPLYFCFACGTEDSCENAAIENFNQFLGIERSTKQIELDGILGRPSEEYYNEDSTKIIYNYIDVVDAPVTVVFNSVSGNVETVMMEILTLGADFNKDLEKAIDRYHIDACESRFFGMNKEGIVEEFGVFSNQENQAGVTLLNYFTKDYKTCITFKFYPEQNNICSTLLINWYS